MPRFNPNPNKVSGSIEILPKDSYHLKLGEPKPAERSKGQDVKVYGIQWPLTVISGAETGSEHAGKTIFFFGEWNNEDGSEAQFANITKNIVMAALGYTPRDNDSEKQFNSDTEAMDWGYDTDNKYVGELWMKTKDCGIMADLDTQNGKGDKADRVYQRFNAFYPVEG